MKNQLVILLLLVMPLSIKANVITINYSVDEDVLLKVDRIQNYLLLNYFEMYTDSVSAEGSFSVNLDRKAPQYLELSVGNARQIIKLMPDVSYEYKLIYKNRELILTKPSGDMDDNTKLNAYSRDYNNFIFKYVIHKRKGLRKRILRDFDDFNNEAKAKYGEFTPEMYYLHKYNQLMLALKLRKYNKIQKWGEEVKNDTAIDFKNPFVINYLNYFIQHDWMARKLDFKPYIWLWDPKTKENLEKIIFEFELYPQNHQLEVFSKMVKLWTTHISKYYTNGKDLIAIADSINNITGVDMPVKFIGYDLHGKLSDYYRTKEAPLFALKDGKGNLHKLEDYQGKPVVLDFWATWCKPCVQAMPSLDTVYQQYKDKVHFISISSDDTVEKMNEYVKQQGYQWLFLFTGSGGNNKVKSDYQAYAIPRLVLIDAKGMVVNFDVKDPLALPDMLDKLLD